MKNKDNIWLTLLKAYFGFAIIANIFLFVVFFFEIFNVTIPHFINESSVIIFLLVTGSIFCFIKGIMVRNNIKKNLLNSTLVNGIILELQYDEGKIYYLLIEYIDIVTKEKSTYTSKATYSHDDFKVGQNVELLVCKNENKEVMYINDKEDIWHYASLLFLGGKILVALLLLGSLIYIVR